MTKPMGPFEQESCQAIQRRFGIEVDHEYAGSVCVCDILRAHTDGALRDFSSFKEAVLDVEQVVQRVIEREHETEK